MKETSRHFDMPPDSPEHDRLLQTAWMGGPLVAVRCYLGRLIGRNLFRESDADVEQRLVEFVSRLTSATGGELMRGADGWSIAAEILRYRFEEQARKPTALAPKLTAKVMMPVELYLTKPSLSLDELAKEANTTPRQLSRNSLLNHVRRVWERAQIENS
jgi:hypothetical protein